MKNVADRFRVRPGERVRLKDWATRVKPYYDSKADYEARLARQVEQMAELQNLLYADDRYALLLVFQAMDAAGKASCIKHVMSGVNPQGCQVYSFKHPSAEELDHDFLWRTQRALPERGRIGIWNRSHYEEVLVVRVHPEYLEGQRLPRVPKNLSQDRERALCTEFDRPVFYKRFDVGVHEAAARGPGGDRPRNVLKLDRHVFTMDFGG